MARQWNEWLSDEVIKQSRRLAMAGLAMDGLAMEQWTTEYGWLMVDEQLAA